MPFRSRSLPRTMRASTLPMAMTCLMALAVSPAALAVEPAPVSAPYKPVTDARLMTAAPLIVKGMVIIGVSGGEYGARGYVTAMDAKTGNQIWQQSTIPAPNEPGGKTWPKGAYKTGGGATWLTGSYDPVTNTLFWGVGNPGPWLATMRPGDNLYSDSVIAMSPATGKIKWHYQYTPNDTWDYDGVNEPVLTNLDYKGTSYKALVSASRNGWFYAIDRSNGKLIYAEKFAHATSVSGFKDGRPVTDPAMRPSVDKEVFTCPSFLGGKNWWPISVDPQTHYAYVPTLHSCMSMKGATVSYKAGLPFLGETFRVQHDPENPNTWGSVQAIDLNTGKQAWIFKSAMPWNGGMLSTAGGLVFSGSAEGYLYAFDAKSGAVIWKSPKMTSGVLGVPSTWKVDGKQYVGVYAAGAAACRSGAVTWPRTRTSATSRLAAISMSSRCEGSSDEAVDAGDAQHPALAS